MLNTEQSQIWEAMGIGPQWLLRETPDPLLPETALTVEGAEALSRAPSSNPASVDQVSSARRAAPQAPALRARPAADLPVRDVRETYRPTAAVAAPVTTPAKAPLLELDPKTAAAIPTADWETLKALALKCECCSMAKTRHHVVFAEGGPGARMVLVGEAPGSEEDLQGVPFVGKSGQLLTQMLESINIRRGEDMAIMNVLKCRPPQNRNPAPAEMACCEQFLRRQLALVKPDVILIMGRFAFQTLLHADPQTSIGSQRGIIHEVEYAPGLFAKAVVSYHPSYLLRAPDQKAKAWEDLLLLKQAVRAAGIELQEKKKTWN